MSLSSIAIKKLYDKLTPEIILQIQNEKIKRLEQEIEELKKNQWTPLNCIEENEIAIGWGGVTIGGPL